MLGQNHKESDAGSETLRRRTTLINQRASWESPRSAAGGNGRGAARRREPELLVAEMNGGRVSGGIERPARAGALRIDGESVGQGNGLDQREMAPGEPVRAGRLLGSPLRGLNACRSRTRRGNELPADTPSNDRYIRYGQESSGYGSPPFHRRTIQQSTTPRPKVKRTNRISEPAGEQDADRWDRSTDA
jgi:hypothetical protein